MLAGLLTLAGRKAQAADDSLGPQSVPLWSVQAADQTRWVNENLR